MLIMCTMALDMVAGDMQAWCPRCYSSPTCTHGPCDRGSFCDTRNNLPTKEGRD